MKTAVVFNYVNEGSYFALEWFDSHPGDSIERALLNYYSALPTVGTRIDEIIIVNNFLIYTYYIPNSKIGISYLADHIFDPTDFYEWFTVIVHFQNLHMTTHEELQKVATRTFSLDHSLTILSSEYLTSIYSTKDASYTYHNAEDLMNIIWTLLNLRPWYILFADQFIIKFDTKTVHEVLSPLYLQKQKDLDLQFIEQKLAIGDTEYQLYIFKVIQFCIGLETNDRISKFITYANLLNKINEEQDIYVQIQTLGENIFDFISLDVEFALAKIQNVINRISQIEDLTKNQILNLLNLSEALASINNPEMAKLVEGTAFELTLKIDDYVAKAELFSRFATIAQKEGINDVVNFVEMLSAFLSPDPKDIQLFESILAIVEPTLTGTNIGLYALLSAYLTLGQPIKAVTIKFQLAHMLTLDEEIAIELLESIIWVLQLSSPPTSEIKDVLEAEFVVAIRKSPPGKPFLNRIEQIFNLLQNTDNALFSVTFTTVILKNLEHVASLDRYDLLQIINKHLDNFPTLAELQSIVHARLFAIALEEELTDELDELFNQTFAKVLPDSPEYSERLLKAIGRIVESSLHYGSMVYFIKTIEYLLQQSTTFDAHFIENGVAGSFQTIFDMIEKSSATKSLIHPDIAVSAATYLLHVIEEHGLNISVEKSIYPLLEFILQHKKYEEYATLLMKLYEAIRLTDPNWPDIINHYAVQLMQVKQTKITRHLYDFLMSQNLPPLQIQKLLRQQLEFAQQFDSNYYDSNEVLTNTLTLISLSQSNADPAEIFQLFQTGLDELQSYGDPQTVLDLCLEVFNYAYEVDAHAQLRPFMLQYLAFFSEYLALGNLSKVGYYLRYPLNLLHLSQFKVELFNLLDKYVLYSLNSSQTNKNMILLFIREFALHYFPTPETGEYQEYRPEFFSLYERVLAVMYPAKTELSDQLIAYSQLLELARILNYKDQILVRLDKIRSSIKKDEPLLPILFLIGSTASLLDVLLDPELDALLTTKAVGLLELMANLYKNLPKYSVRLSELQLALQTKAIQVTALPFEINGLITLYDSLNN